MGGFSLKIRELLFSSVLLLCIFSRVALALSPDGQALVNFRISVLGSDGVLKQWRPEDSDPCGWKGVLCDPKSKRVISLILPDHKLSGSISPDIGKLDQLQFLALHDNNFYGTIPPALGNCSKLKSLFLQGNYLSGWIPDELGNLRELENLDLSSNSLSGNIPPSLGKLNNLVSFNVSTNFLVGQIPTDGHLANFGNDSFIGNRNLCGQQISQDCKAGGPSFSRFPVAAQNESKNGRLLISASATVGALLLVALMCFWGCFLYKRLGKNDGKSLAMDVCAGASIVMFHGDLPYSSKDIIKKLETLNGEHIIGSGGFGTVYKLAMDDGNVFALKRIMKMNEGFDRFFERELEILGSIKHRYLVNLRGYCNSPTSKLLMYDFLSGGSLDEVLHERSEQLDWGARLTVIMGAAKGLAYLHHDCSPRVIHRDIKASNILLDGNFEARVSDFGLAKLLGDEESHITTIVAGTFGYLAPEYMQSGRATEKTDVYSFGVLVLEVISGKRPTDASYIEKGFNIVGWLNFLASENRRMEIVDPHCERVQTESLDALLSVATQCVSSSPDDRPTCKSYTRQRRSSTTMKFLIIFAVLISICSAANPRVRFANSLVAYPNVFVETNIDSASPGAVSLGAPSPYKQVPAGLLTINVYELTGNSSIGATIISTSVTTYEDRYYTIPIFLDTSFNNQIDIWWDSIALADETAYSNDKYVLKFFNLAPNTNNAQLYYRGTSLLSFVGYLVPSGYIVLSNKEDPEFQVKITDTTVPLGNNFTGNFEGHKAYSIFVYGSPNGGYFATTSEDRTYNAAVSSKANLVLMASVLLAYLLL